MATIKEVAVRAGASIGTVSNVLSGLPTVGPTLRRRVEKAIRELHYSPNHVARSLKTRQSRMIGMVVSDITNPFFPEMVRGAEDAALERGYLLTTFNSDDDLERERRAVDVIRQRRMDGLLMVVALSHGEGSHLRAVMEAGIPMVCLDRIPEGIASDTVTIDNTAAAAEAVRHLIAQGHKRIGYIGGRRNMYIGLERRRGYLNAMREAGRKPEALEGDFRRESGHSLALRMFQAVSHPSAVFVGNLQMTLGVLQALEELSRRVPQDVAVATFDHFEWLDAFRPRLTAVVQPACEMGSRGAHLLIDRIERVCTDTAPVSIELKTVLRKAESSNRKV